MANLAATVKQPPQGFGVKHWVLFGALAVAVLGLAGVGLTRGVLNDASHDGGTDAEDGSPSSSTLTVKTVRPQVGGMDRISRQPGSIQTYESVAHYPAVSGYLKKLNVDIGSRVKKGEVLAVIEVPELVKQLEHHKAVVDHANAKVTQMRAHKRATQADLAAAKASVNQALAAVKSADAWQRYREKAMKRMEDLWRTGSIEERVYDESRERYEAAVEAQRAAEETVTANRCRVEAVEAKVSQADADIEEAEADVKVAQAEVGKTQEMLNYATIPARFDGVVTQRSQDAYEGVYIRAITSGGVTPLLTVQRTDLMRVVVQLPDRDVPYADVGDEATVELDSQPGKPFKATIARKADALDPQTRMMRVELDLPNTTGKVFHGMFGRVTIVLEKSVNVLALPESCIVNRTDTGKGQVFVVRAGKVYLKNVDIIGYEGSNVGVSGLKATDDVVVRPSGSLSDGMAVTVAAPTKGGRAAK
jgi:RND family efflux transporter MFP subunit